jgi:hypothetical protein
MKEPRKLEFVDIPDFFSPRPSFSSSDKPWMKKQTGVEQKVVSSDKKKQDKLPNSSSSSLDSDEEVKSQITSMLNSDRSIIEEPAAEKSLELPKSDHQIVLVEYDPVLSISPIEEQPKKVEIQIYYPIPGAVNAEEEKPIHNPIPSKIPQVEPEKPPPATPPPPAKKPPKKSIAPEDPPGMDQIIDEMINVGPLKFQVTIHGEKGGKFIHIQILEHTQAERVVKGRQIDLLSEDNEDVTLIDLAYMVFEEFNDQVEMLVLD